MADPRFVAVLDIGKSNVKVVLHDIDTATDLAVRTTPNEVRQDGPYPHFDTTAIQDFFLAGLADIRRERREPIEAISITAHGASGVLLGEQDLALPVLDYEHAGPDTMRDAYARVRPAFAETFSPRLPGGLNLGAQYFWQSQTFGEAFARTRWLITYPQYWAWWLTGVVANEVTSLGAHTDLWAPKAGRFSSLVEQMGWQDRMAPVRSAFDILGPLRPDLARCLGLDAIPVACGIHDSNASLLPHLMGSSTPSSVVSTGTWVICFASGGLLDGLDADRDTLANVDAFARPVPSARFMGGREFEMLAARDTILPDDAAVARVIERGVMALPTFAPGTGPFPRGTGCWTHSPESLGPAERVAAASLYAALVTATSLGLLNAQGPTVVEGPFARNALYLAALQAVTDRPVTASGNATGTSVGAALLVRGAACRAAAPSALLAAPTAPLLGRDFRAYAERWRGAAAA